MKTTDNNFQRKHNFLLKTAHENVVCLQADINYTFFVFDSGKKEVMSYTISKYANILSDSFIRINKSCMVNKKFVKSINQVSHSLVLKNGNELKISRRKFQFVVSDFTANHLC